MTTWKLWIAALLCMFGSLLPLQAQGSYTTDGSMLSKQKFIGVWGSYGYSLQNGISVHGYGGISPKEFSATFLPTISIGLAFETVKVANESHQQWPSTRWEKYAPSWLFQCEFTHIRGSVKEASSNLPVLRTLVGDTILSPAALNADVSLSVLHFDVFRKYRVREITGYRYSYESWISPFYVAIGGTVGWAISGTMQESAYLQGNTLTTKLLPIEGATIDEQGQRAEFQEKSLPVSNRFRFGLKAGVLYEIKALPSSRSPVNALTIIPSLWVEYPVVNVQGDYSLKSVSVHVGLSLSFAIDNPVVYDEYKRRYITPAEFPGNYPYDYPPYKKD